ncbi:hypothetical protein [Thalassolituus sp. C2-1]|uniref:hypothetical protein n=1 Tax=Venatorbacter sp. C2-1 TaxID=2597518 RepID=UPI00118F3FD6|nr:hypothetical protein [Thalassolituus sp. C2-1]TVV45493.1 hypothetical protein FOT50_01245 [Thalassolituus sp. C2-1]
MSGIQADLSDFHRRKSTENEQRKQCTNNQYILLFVESDARLRSGNKTRMRGLTPSIQKEGKKINHLGFCEK